MPVWCAALSVSVSLSLSLSLSPLTNLSPSPPLPPVPPLSPCAHAKQLGNLLHTVGLRRMNEPSPDAGPSDAPGADELQEAAALLRESLERSRGVLGDRNLNTHITRSNLGAVLRNLGALDEAASCIREAVEGVAAVGRTRGADDLQVARVREGFGELDQPLAAYAGPLDS